MLTLLLPPSEGKAPGGGDPAWDPASGRFGPALAEQRRAVVDALGAAGGGDQRLLGVKGEALDRARSANTSLLGGPTLPAWQRYTGVVWDHLDVGSLPGPLRRRARASVVVVSALTGLTMLGDPLPDHRLKLSVRLGDLGRLSTWWQPTVSEVLNAHLRRRLVVDLLPNEHAAAWTPQPGCGDVRRVRLVDARGRAVGHDAKAAKGLLARALLEADDPERALATWRHPTYHLDVTTP